MAVSKAHPDTAREDVYWHANFRNRPYVAADEVYDDYGPAYAYGIVSFGRFQGRPYDDVESELSRDWEIFKGKSRLTWERAKSAVRDAWDRLID